MELVPEAQLQLLVADLVGKTVSLAQLNGAAERITAEYRKLGYFLSRAVIPPQDARDGTVRIRVVEAVYGQTDTYALAYDGAPVEQTGLRLQSARAGQILAAQGVVPGAPVQRGPLERGLLILNDFPGLQTQASLSPGTASGSSDLRVGLQEGRIFTSQVSLDNLGNRYTGTSQVRASLNINDPLGYGEVFRLSGLKSSGLTYLSAGYQMPLGNNGWKVGASLSGLDYRLCCSFAAINAKGNVRTAGAHISFPFILRATQTLTGGLSLERREAVDEVSGMEIADRQVNTATAGMSWSVSDAWGGFNSLYGAATFGHLDLSGNPANALFDAATAQTQGHYSKLRVTYSRVQDWSGVHQLRLRLGGQLASKNLDSSEKLSVGGPDGVRAYAQGEAAADQAFLATVEYSYTLPLDVPGRVQGSVFADAGHAHLNKTTWPGFQGTRPNLPNTYSLSGWGFGLQWQSPQGIFLQASIAAKLGSNPGRLANGDDVNGRSRSTRVSLALGMPF